MTQQSIDREKLLDMWSAGAPARYLADVFNCSTSSVYRITRHAFCEDGDLRGSIPAQEVRDLWKADLNKEAAAKLASKGMEVAAIGAKLGLQDHIVRASIYLATKAGLRTGFVVNA